MNGYPSSAHVTTSSVLTQVQATISDLESFNGLFKEATVPSQGLASYQITSDHSSAPSLPTAAQLTQRKSHRPHPDPQGLS